MTTLTHRSKQATACGAAALRVSWREGVGAAAGIADSGIGIGLVVVDASRRGCAVPVVAGYPSAANRLFAAGF